jgi:hypothetical protein
MNFIQVFQSYRSLNSDSIKANTLYKPSQVLMKQPDKKYIMPHDFFSKINATAYSVNNNNSNSPSFRKIMYINTDLDYNFDEPNLNETHTQIKPKFISYLLTSIFIIFPFTYYYYIYNSQSLQSKK